MYGCVIVRKHQSCISMWIYNLSLCHLCAWCRLEVSCNIGKAAENYTKEVCVMVRALDTLRSYRVEPRGGQISRYIFTYKRTLIYSCCNVNSLPSRDFYHSILYFLFLCRKRRIRNFRLKSVFKIITTNLRVVVANFENVHYEKALNMKLRTKLSYIRLDKIADHCDRHHKGCHLYEYNWESQSFVQPPTSFLIQQHPCNSKKRFEVRQTRCFNLSLVKAGQWKIRCLYVFPLSLSQKRTILRSSNSIDLLRFTQGLNNFATSHSLFANQRLLSSRDIRSQEDRETPTCSQYYVNWVRPCTSYCFRCDHAHKQV